MAYVGKVGPARIRCAERSLPERLCLPWEACAKEGSSGACLPNARDLVPVDWCEVRGPAALSEHE